MINRTLICFTALVISALHATDYKWNQPTGGDWKNPANWKPYGYPSSPEDKAIFETATGTKNFVTYAGTVAVGHIQFKNFSNTGWEIAGPGFLHLGGATLSGITSTYGSDQISCPVVMASDLECVVAANHSFSFSGGLIGQMQLKESGSGSLIIGGGGNFSGPIEIHNGQVMIVTPEAITNEGGSITLINGTFWNRSADVLNTSRQVYVQEKGVVGAIANSPFIIEKPILGKGSLTLKGYVQAPDGSSYSGDTFLGRAGLGQVIATTKAFPGNIYIDLLTTLEIIGEGVGEIDSEITGQGSLDLSRMQGTLILTGRNRYTGGTKCGGQTLSGTTLGLQGTIIGQGKVQFNQKFDGIFSGKIEGETRVEFLKTNTATIQFTGQNTYSGGTKISGGTLQITTENVKGNIEIDSEGMLSFCQDNQGTFSSVISGSGKVLLPKENTALINFDKQHTYEGGTEIYGGSLAIISEGCLSSNGSVINNATFDISKAKNLQVIGDLSGSGTVILGNNSLVLQAENNSSIFTGDVIGSGRIVKKGKGAAVFYGANHHTGGIELQEGVLQISQDAQLGDSNAPLVLHGGSLKITSDITLTRPCILTSSGVVSIDEGTTCKIQAALEGEGGFTKFGRGNLILEADSTYQGPTVLTDGAIILQAKEFAIHGPLNIEGGQLVLHSTGQIAPSSDVVMHQGLLDLSGNNTAWKSFTFTGGNLKQGEGILSLDGQDLVLTLGDVIVPGTIDLLQEDSVVVAKGHAQIARLNMPMGDTALQVSDHLTLEKSVKKGGTLSKTGKGDLCLEGNHVWASARIEQGRLNLVGQLMSNLVVAQGSFLQGNGVFYGDMILEGVLQPGASIGTIQMIGNQTFNPGSVLEIEFDTSRSDKVKIDGSLSIQPDATLHLQRITGSFLRNTTYSIIETQTGSISGTFTHVLNHMPPAFQFNTIYNPMSILIELYTLPFRDLVAHGNAGKVATALDNITYASGSDLQEVYLELLNMPTVELLSSSLRQIDPSMLKGLALVQESNAIRVNEALDHRITNIMTKTCHDEKKNRGKWGLWADFIGNYYYQGKIYHEAPFHAGTGGALIAFDYLDPTQYFVGAGLGYSYSSITWNNTLGNGDINSGYGMVYGGWHTDLFYLQATLQGSYNQYHEQRHIKFGYLDRRTHGNFSGAELLGQIGIGSLLHAASMEFNPFITSEFIYLHQSEFNETGAESLNLNIYSSNYTMVRSEVGLNMSRCFPLKHYSLRLEGKLSYIREDRFHGKEYTAEFLGTDVPFTVKGMNPNRNLFSPGFSLAFITPSKRSEVSFSYDAEVNGNYWDQNLNLQLGHRF